MVSVYLPVASGSVGFLLSMENAVLLPSVLWACRNTEVPDSVANMKSVSITSAPVIGANLRINCTLPFAPSNTFNT
ncbi:hypothetical protein D3C76_1236040 [compost metagenome]